MHPIDICIPMQHRYAYVHTHPHTCVYGCTCLHTCTYVDRVLHVLGLLQLGWRRAAPTCLTAQDVLSTTSHSGSLAKSRMLLLPERQCTHCLWRKPHMQALCLWDPSLPVDTGHQLGVRYSLGSWLHQVLAWV